MLEIPEAAVGAISAALIAALVSLLGLIISKENKISEFRQAWVDSLRSELSQLIAHANAIHGAAAAGFIDASEMWKVVRQDFIGVNEAAAKIRLRLNPDESVAKKVLENIADLEGLLSPGSSMSHVEINEKEKELVSIAQALLKREWGRVRSGEKVFRIFKALALCIFSIAAVALVLVAVFKAGTI